MSVRPRVLGVVGAMLLATVGVTIAGATIGAEPAQAASCTYSNLSSKSVKNVSCGLGAYAYKSGGKWHRSGNWVSKGKYSSNWYKICYAKPGMLGIV